MAKNPNIIRVGDRVRIDNPKFFIRCGYPKCLTTETSKEYNVMYIRFVKIGKYYSPSNGYSYDGDDYEPGGLEDQKTHKLLRLDSWFFPDDESTGLDLVTIEACHVTKIKSGVNQLSFVGSFPC